MHIKSLLILVIGLAGFVNVEAYAQTPESLLADGKKQEQRYNDEEALKIYESALRIAPKNQLVVTKCADVSLAIALRQKDEAAQLEGLDKAWKYATVAAALDTTNTYANATAALTASEIAKRLNLKKRKELAESIGNYKLHADRCLQFGAGDAKALHMAGRWHLDVLQLNDVKKAAINLVYGADAKNADIKEAIRLMEAAKTADQYYTLNFYDLAEAYRVDKQYEKAIDLLQQLQKLPAKRQFDKDVKAAGAAALQRLQ